MIAEPPSNLTARPYRGLSVQEVDIGLDPGSILAFLLGREVYRRTEFILLEHSERYALVQVEKESATQLFSPVTDVRVLARPEELVFVASPETDVGNASAIAAVATAHRRADALAYVVRGRFEHINFLWKPEPITVEVTELVPPRPPKLLAMAQQAVDFDEDLPPIDLQPADVDMHDLVAGEDKGVYLLPCRGSGVSLTSEVEFLDTRPAERRDWVLVGCERSEQFHEHFYGDLASRVDICPRRRTTVRDRATLTLTKCCLLERGVRLGPGYAVVPWGSNLDEVRLALRFLVGLGPPNIPEAAADTWESPLGQGLVGTGTVDSP